MALGLAVLGLDHWYTAFGVLETAVKSEKTPLIGIYEPDGNRHESVREKYPETPLTSIPESLLTRDDVQIVAICAGTYLAPELAKMALQAGKHVVSVKPPAMTLADLEGVRQVAADAGRFFGSFEGMQRLQPRAVLLRELVQGGAIGTPISSYQIAHGGLPAPWQGQTGDSWWLHKDKVPGGAWIDHAIYAVDLARFIFEGEIISAHGIIENRVHRDLELEDYGLGLFRLQPNHGGTPITLSFEDTWTATPGNGRHHQETIGTQGYLYPDGGDWVVVSGGETKRYPIPTAPFFRLDALADLLEKGETPPFGVADAYANLKACLAVYESARQG
jgi:predicted dehydrogenase